MHFLFTLLFFLPIFGCFLLFFIKDTQKQTIQYLALVITLFTFFISVLVCLLFDPYQLNFQSMYLITLPFLYDFSFLIGIDGLSLLFILLTTFLFPFCILINWNQISTYVKEYVLFFFLLEAILILVFSVLDLFLFYVCFESVLIPMFIYIGVWGSRERKIYAAYMLFFYTLVGSLFMLIGILAIFYFFGTTDIQLLHSVTWDVSFQKLLWLSFFASFAVKIPMFPFHIWLPEAHVEAPTAGSVLLAGVLLKMGGYGFLRFTLPMYPEATIYFLPLVFMLAVVAILYTSLTTIRQTDIKRIIAYSSVGHMNMVIVGIFSLTLISIEGSFFLMLSHGIVSGGLFLCIGMLYHKHKTRLIRYYGGLVQMMPIFVSLLCLFVLANLSLPTTSSFVGEFLVLLGTFEKNMWVAFLSSSTMILGAAYSLWFFNRLSFGNLKLQFINKYVDIDKKETFLLIPLVVFVFGAGLAPNLFFSYLHGNVAVLLFPYTEAKLSLFFLFL